MTDDVNFEGTIPLDHVIVPAARLRQLRRETIEDLAVSMAKIGLLHPIHVNEDGTLLAGRHRLEAARKLGWKEIPATIVDGRSEDLMRLVEIDENLMRADLSPAERAAHQAERKAIYLREFPKTRHGGDRKSSSQVENLICDHPTSSSPPLVDRAPHTVPRYTKDAARAQGVSWQTVHREASRGEAIPGVARLAGTSLDKGEELDALAKLPPQRQQSLIEKAMDGGRVSAKTELKAIKRNEKELELADRTAAVSKELGTKLYNVIYSDPPWRFEPYSRETGMDRAADNHYPTMTIEDIGNIKVPAAENCVLFLWATAPMLSEAMWLIERWGFKYKSHCVWVKDRIGTGYWFRNAHELLLVATRGDIPAPSPGTQWSSVIVAEVNKHSSKPTSVAEMIEKLFPNLPKLEMFARSTRDGWESWGNETK